MLNITEIQIDVYCFPFLGACVGPYKFTKDYE